MFVAIHHLVSKQDQNKQNNTLITRVIYSQSLSWLIILRKVNNGLFGELIVSYRLERLLTQDNNNNNNNNDDDNNNNNNNNNIRIQKNIINNFVFPLILSFKAILPEGPANNH